MTDVELTRALERGEIKDFHHASHLHVAWVYLAESSRTTIASARELESFSRYPVLATAPQDIRVARKPWSGFKKQRASRSERDTASPRNMIPAIQKLGGIHET